MEEIELPWRGDGDQKTGNQFLLGQRFQSGQVEELYQQYVYVLRKGSLAALLGLLATLSLLIGLAQLVFEAGLRAQSLCWLGGCAAAVILLLLLHTKLMSGWHLRALSGISTSLLLLLSVLTLPVHWSQSQNLLLTPAEHLWPLLSLVLLAYMFLPLPLLVPLLFGVIAPMLHCLCSVFLADISLAPLWRLILANLCLYAAVNACGVYLHVARESALRRAFLDLRSTVRARFELQQEHCKLDSLLDDTMPPQLAEQFKADLNRAHFSLFPDNLYLQEHKTVSIAVAELRGFASLSTCCSPADMLRILHDLLGKLDTLASDNHCWRLRTLGDSLLCLSGFPEVRVDHARCAVRLALDIVNTLRSLGCSGQVALSARVGVHSGACQSGLVGLKRRQFDVWSSDVEIAHALTQSVPPGSVHVSHATLLLLDGEFDFRPLQSRDMAPYGDTFVIVDVESPQPVNAPSGGRGDNDEGASGHVTASLLRALARMRGPECQPLPLSQLYTTAESLESLHQTSVAPFLKNCTQSLKQTAEQRTNQHLAKAMQTKSLDKPRSQVVFSVTQRFRNPVRERQFVRDHTGISGALLVALVSLIVASAVHALVLARTILLLLMFLLNFCWIASLLMIVLASKLGCLSWQCQSSPIGRSLLFATTILLLESLLQVSGLCCTSLGDNGLAIPSQQHLNCATPQYLHLSALLVFVLVSCFLHVSALVKFLFIIILFVVHVLVFVLAQLSLFRRLDVAAGNHLPASVSAVLSLLHCGVLVLLHVRQMDWILRLGFLWRDQGQQQKTEITELEANWRRLLCNLLPTPVAAHFLERQSINQLYSRWYPRSAVCFVSICQLEEYCRQLAASGQPTQVLSLLHAVMCRLDQLLNDSKYADVTKVKSFGPTFVLVTGLNGAEDADAEETALNGVSLLADLLLAMKLALQDFQDNAGILRLSGALHCGPIVAGVVGSRRPQFDVWGAPVNVARELDRSTKPDCIQVSQPVYASLRHLYQFHQGGTTNSGTSTSYFLVARKSSESFEVAPLVPPRLESFHQSGHKRNSLHEMLLNVRRNWVWRDDTQKDSLRKSLMTPQSSLTRSLAPPSSPESPPEARPLSPDLPTIHFRNVHADPGAHQGTLLRQSQLMDRQLPTRAKTPPKSATMICSVTSQSIPSVANPLLSAPPPPLPGGSNSSFKCSLDAAPTIPPLPYHAQALPLAQSSRPGRQEIAELNEIMRQLGHPEQTWTISSNASSAFSTCIQDELQQKRLQNRLSQTSPAPSSVRHGSSQTDSASSSQTRLVRSPILLGASSIGVRKETPDRMLMESAPSGSTVGSSSQHSSSSPMDAQQLASQSASPLLEPLAASRSAHPRLAKLTALNGEYDLIGGGNHSSQVIHNGYTSPGSAESPGSGSVLLNGIHNGIHSDRSSRKTSSASSGADGKNQNIRNSSNDEWGSSSLDKSRAGRSDFQVKRRQKFRTPVRLCRSLDYIPSDLEDGASSVGSRADSPSQQDDPQHSRKPPFVALVRQFADNVSLSSVASSEISRSEPDLHGDSGSAAYESEYDNYRPGMASDEDYFIQEPISDIDIDAFDEMNVDDVTVSDTYSLDLPLPKKPLARKISEV